MFDKLKSLFSAADFLDPNNFRTLQLATAMLLLKMAKIDGKVEPSERESISLRLAEHFSLTSMEIESLLIEVEGVSDDELVALCVELSDTCPEQSRLQLLASVIEVARSDARIEAMEEKLVLETVSLLKLEKHLDAFRAMLFSGSTK